MFNDNSQKIIIISIIGVSAFSIFLFFSLYQSEVDKFGISKLYPTTMWGREWYANWDNGLSREFEAVNRDPFDSELQMRGKGTLSVNGNGIATLAGDSPRILVRDVSKPNWDNVEVTFYAKRISEGENSSNQGFWIGARSEHQDSDEDPCKGATYYGGFLYDGKITFLKELVHNELYSERFPDTPDSFWENEMDGLPKNTWIGIKYVVYSEKNGVKLELYRDLKDGTRGGEWEKMVEFLDSGKNIPFESDYDVIENCGFDKNKILFSPGSSVFLRNDGIERAEYKNFSVREINAP